MGMLCDYLANKLVDHVHRNTSYAAPTVAAHALILATRGYSSNVRSAVVSIGDTVIPTTPNGRLYKCTTGGTCGAGEPTWGTVNGGTTADGTAVWTEQYTAMKAGTFTEVANSGGYARASLNQSTTNWANTQNSGSGASSGTSDTTSNSVAITFPAPTGNWGVIFGVVQLDSAVYGGGNALLRAVLTTPKTVNNGDPAPSIAIGALSFQYDS
jgi:hypothetical protein